MSNSNSNYQNLIFEMFRWLAQKCKKKYVTVYMVHVGRKSVMSRGHLWVIGYDHVNSSMSGANWYNANIMTETTFIYDNLTQEPQLIFEN